MKATGIVRRIDDLGRVVVPKEIRRTMRIREGQAMEIYTGREGEIILKKYSPIEAGGMRSRVYKIDFNGDRVSRLCFGSGTDCSGKRAGTEKLSWQVHQQPAGGGDSEPENSTCASR